MSNRAIFADLARSRIAASKEPKQLMPVHTLCEDCRRMFSSPLYERYPGTAWGYQNPNDHRAHERRVSQIEHQARYGGCYICHHLWRPVTKAMQSMVSKMPLYKNRDRGEARIDFEVRWRPKKQFASLWFTLTWGALQTGSASFLLVPAEILPEETLEANMVTTVGDNFQMVSKLSASTKSEESWTAIFDWLKRCNPEQHPRCHSNVSNYEMPTRLVDIREGGCLRIKTMTTAHPGEKHEYVALSHCWGKIEFLNLNSNTAEKLFAGFPETLLPRSFQDAVAATRKLGISFLWIDALCIMQDSTQDWLHESERMADVFSGAYCTIAATAAHDSSEGFFFERTAATTQPFRVTTAWKNNIPDNSNLHNSYLIYPESYWQDMASLAPLLTRAWVVQERLLSRRVIHFAKPQIFWECSHLMACEVFPVGVPSQPSGISFYKPATTDGESVPPIETADQSYVDHSSWNSIVEYYTSCKLTFGKDKLVAIAGIAKAFGSADTDRGRYIAGLWEKDFLRQLLWKIKEDQVSERPKTYRAPSWSWASLDNELAGVAVWEDSRHSVPKALSLIDVGTSLPSTEHKSEDTAIMFPRWYVRIEGPLHKVIVWRRDLGVLGVVQTDVLIPALHPPMGRFRASLDDDPKHHNLPHGDVYLVPLLLLETGDGKAIVRGLLIRRARKSTEGAITRVLFRRVGMAVGTSFHLTSADAAKVFRGAQRLPQDSYEERREVAVEGQTHYLYKFTLI